MYWERRELKSKAKQVLKTTYLTTFIICLVLLIFGGSVFFGRSTHNNNRRDREQYYFSDDQVHEYSGDGFYIDNGNGGRVENYHGNSVGGFFGNVAGSIFSFIFAIGTLIFALIYLVVKIVIGYTLQIGATKYLIETAGGKYSDLSALRYVFKEKSVFNVIKTMFIRDLFTFLWSLLFVVPGIIKYYQYYMVPYILADNPNIEYNRALSLSKKMTQGHKWNIFVLELSFILWNILAGIIPFKVGFALLCPYVEATKAQLYLVLRENALGASLTDNDELRLSGVVIQ
ncbi:MAG: DUF975 family protein [Clostridiales bacterium]|jgi:uncharacterized membrane protein|nr:DUF975 family protein [Clostridiales bacterium]